VHSRYTQGNWTTDHTRLEEVGPVVSARVVEPQDEITVMTANGIVLRTKVEGIRICGRITKGVRIVNLGEGDLVAAVAVLPVADLNRGVDGGGADGGAGDDAAALPEAGEALEIEYAEAEEADLVAEDDDIEKLAED
jgi:hypothetical protein